MAATRRNVAVRIDAADVPDGLVALHVERALVGDDGRPQVRGPGPDGPRQLLLAADDATGVVGEGLTHGTVRRALATPTRRRSTRDELSTDEVATALARAGLVRLKVPASRDGGTVRVGEWRTWERTRAGGAWADAYAAVDLDDPLVAHAVPSADARADGTADDWATDVAAEVARVHEVCEHAATLVNDGEAHGWSLAEFAEAVTGSPTGLDEDAPLAALVLGHLARRLGVGEAPTSASERRALLASAGIGASALAGTVASVRLPGGGGAVGSLLGAAASHDVPLLLQRALLTEGGGRPVAAPRALNWVFAVQHESTFTAAAELPSRTPVVLHGGSVAALALLAESVRSGWRVVVVSDDDEVSRDRQRWLLERLGDGAVAWRAGDDPDASPSESRETAALLADITSGQPG